MADALKDMYDRAAVDFLAARIAAVQPKFPRQAFVREVAAALPPLELKARSLRIAAGLRQHLPQDYAAALGIILKSLGKDDSTGGIGGGGIEGMGGFRFMPLLNFVGAYGLDEPELSLDALGELTLYFSGEFDIRPYLRKYPRQAFAKLQQLSRDKDWRRRRLASEGSRPRLPWGMGLPDLVRDPSPALPILHRLHDDAHDSVRRSVANHLNDIARDHPELAVDIAGQWAKRAGRKPPETLRPTIRHALRGLVKQGHPGALGLLGFEADVKLALQDFKLKAQSVAYGGALEFSATLINRGKTPVNLSIDYAIWHLRADGSLRPKVFKLAVREAAPGESIALTKRHAIKPITTRRYYAGKQAVDIRVNGQVLGRCDFTLKM